VGGGGREKKVRGNTTKFESKEILGSKKGSSTLKEGPRRREEGVAEGFQEEMEALGGSCLRVLLLCIHQKITPKKRGGVGEGGGLEFFMKVSGNRLTGTMKKRKGEYEKKGGGLGLLGCGNLT